VIASTQCGCTPDLIEEGITGWNFKPGGLGEQKIMQILQNLLEDRTILHTMGDNAWQRLQPYSYSSVLEKIKHLLTTINPQTKQGSLI